MKKLYTLLLALGLLVGSANVNASFYYAKCGGGTIGFWGNKHGIELMTYYDLEFLRHLCLYKTDGTPVTFLMGSDWWKSQDKVGKWLRGGHKDKMEYKLSIQLTAFVLNTWHRKWAWGEVVGDSGLTARELIYYSNQALLATDGSDSVKELQEYYKNILDWANNVTENKPCY